MQMFFVSPNQNQEKLQVRDVFAVARGLVAAVFFAGIAGCGDGQPRTSSGVDFGTNNIPAPEAPVEEITSGNLTGSIVRFSDIRPSLSECRICHRPGNSEGAPNNLRTKAEFRNDFDDVLARAAMTLSTFALMVTSPLTSLSLTEPTLAIAIALASLPMATLIRFFAFASRSTVQPIVD